MNEKNLRMSLNFGHSVCNMLLKLVINFQKKISHGGSSAIWNDSGSKTVFNKKNL